jgi:hypothetical protein
MTTISVFAPFKLGRRLLACERDSARSYIMIADGVRSSMSVEDAETLGKRGWKIHQRWERRTAGMMKPGVLFSIQTPETLDTIGVSDDGFSIYVEADEERIPLSGDEVQMFLFALRRLRDDVSSLWQSSNGGEPYQLNAVPATRAALDARLPPWARED